MRVALAVLLLWVGMGAACAEEKFPAEAVAQIQASLRLGCTLEPLEAKLELIANNGFRVERWRVRTCEGLATFEVVYLPRAFFPDRDSEYQARQLGGFTPEKQMETTVAVRHAPLDALSATDDQDPGAGTFLFSKALATADDPVVISRQDGGALTAQLRMEHRTSLQKYWLSQRVPEQYEFQVRDLAECKGLKPGVVSVCDCYRYRDPATGERQEYWIYVGNWE